MAQRCGANVNILLNLTKQLRKCNQVDVLCKTNDFRPVDPEKAQAFDHCIPFSWGEAEMLTQFQEKNCWNHCGAAKKALLLLTHPRILLYMCDMKFFDGRISGNRYKKQIQEVCAGADYDVVIGLSAPYYITRAVAEAKVPCRKAAIQLDPYTYNYTLPCFLTKRREKIERKVLQKLDHLFAASFVHEEMTAKNLPAGNAVTAFLLPGILVEDDCWKQLPETKPEDNAHINCVFVGQFYDQIRSPKYLLELFCALPENFRLHIFGGGAAGIIKPYEQKLGERLIQHGWVSAEQARTEMYRADFLLNVNNSITNQMASKLFEYVGTGKPIINVCKSETCPSIRYAGKYVNCLNVIETLSLETNRDALCRFADQAQGRTVSREEVLQAFHECTDVYVAQLIQSKLQEMI